MHVPLGLLMCLLGWIAWWLVIVFFVGFAIYELDEDFHLRDGAYTDLKGMLWGIAIGGIIMFGLKLGGVI